MMTDSRFRFASDESAAARQCAVDIFVVISLVFLADALDAALQDASSMAVGAIEAPVKRVILLPTFIGSVILLARHWRTTRAMLLAAAPILLLVLFAAVSTLWSAAPSVSFSWACGLAGTTAFGLLLASRYTALEQMRLVAIATALIAAGSALMAVLPMDAHLGLGVRDDGWVGLYLHRNLLGRVMALSVVAQALLAAASPRARPAAGLGCLVSAGLLALTRSRTAEIAAVIALAAAVMLGIAQRLPGARQARFLSRSAAVVALVAAVVATRPNWFLAPLGRDATLSGRVEIWTDVIAGISARPWFGYGYGAFWRVFSLRPGNPNAVSIGQSPQAHNAFLDLAAELGLAGVLLFLVPFALYLRRAVRDALSARSFAALWPATFFVFLLVANLAESALVRHKIYWALYVAAALSTLRPDDDRRSGVSLTAQAVHAT